MILIVGAMAIETQEIIKLMADYKSFTILDKSAYLGNIHQQKVLLLTTNIGKTNAASAISAAIALYPIQKIINIGLAGGFSPLKIGDIVLVKQAIHHDFDLSIFGYEKGQVPHLPTYFQTDLKLLNHASSLFNTYKVTLYTGDTFSTVHKDDLAVCDMEGASFYQVAFQNHIPILSIKIVSDIIGSESQLDNYEAFEKQASNLIKSIIDQLLK